MTDKLEEIRRKVAQLKKDAEELQRLKADCDAAKKLRKTIVKTKFD